MRKMFLIFGYIQYLFAQIVKCHWQVARAVLSPKLPDTSGFVKVPLELKSDWALFILAQSITLTPGTISVAISSDRKSILIHSMFIKSQKTFIKETQGGFEKRLREIFK